MREMRDEAARAAGACAVTPYYRSDDGAITDPAKLDAAAGLLRACARRVRAIEAKIVDAQEELGRANHERNEAQAALLTLVEDS